MNPASESAASPAEKRPTITASDVGGDRLWAPWRLRYVAGGEREDGCIFCNRLADKDDVQNLILYRGDRSFVIMNRYPYNTGHVMIVPNTHVSSPEDADSEAMAEMALLRRPVLRAIRRTLSPDGFNLGLNIGTTAGAGISDHFHEHVVPRWQGDANFMPILASTMVMPELIPVTYAKLRAEIDRELGSGNSVTTLILSQDQKNVLVDETGRPPQVPAREGEPIWRTALRDAHERGANDTEILGWAGLRQADDQENALDCGFLIQASFSATHQLPPGHQLIALEELFSDSNADLARVGLQRTGNAHVE